MLCCSLLQTSRWKLLSPRTRRKNYDNGSNDYLRNVVRCYHITRPDVLETIISKYVSPLSDHLSLLNELQQRYWSFYLFILGCTNLTSNSSSYILSNDGMEYAERMGEDVERSGKRQGVLVLD